MFFAKKIIDLQDCEETFLKAYIGEVGENETVTIIRHFRKKATATDELIAEIAMTFEEVEKLHNAMKNNLTT